MTTPDQITEEDLQDYLDDRLSDQRRGEVAAYLSENPAKAAEIEALRFQDDALRSLGASILEEPVPERLTAVLRSASETEPPPRPVVPPPAPSSGHHFRFVEVAAALFIFVLGGAVGWVGNGQMQRGPSELEMVLSDSSFAFATLMNNEDNIYDFGPDQGEQLKAAAQRIFKRAINLPDLTEVGLNYRGARILPNARRQVAYFLFQDESGRQISITIWPSSLPANPSVVTSKTDQVQARYWLSENLGYAVMGPADDSILDAITEEVYAFYQDPSS